MSNNFNGNLDRAIKTFFNVETITPFLIGSLCLGIFSNAIYDLIKKSLGESIPNFALIALSAFLIFILAAVFFSWRLSRISQVKTDPLLATKDRPQRHKGLILLVSRQQTCQVAIDFHLPELKQCWLICSTKSQPEAQVIRSMYVNQVVIDEPIVINDVYDPVEYARAIDRIYTKDLPKDWQESDIIADFAGMTANGSVGMALICYYNNRSLQYTPAVMDKVTGQITGSAEPIEIKLQ
jgi:hypothetical protein